MKTGGFVVLERLSTVLRHFVATTTPAAAEAPSTGHGGIVRDDRIRYAFVDHDVEDMVRRAIDHVLEEDRPTTPKEKRPPRFVPHPAPVPASDADIADAVARLFTVPMLAALDEKRRLAARAATLEAIRLSELWALEEARMAAYLAREAQERDDEEALLAILLAS